MKNFDLNNLQNINVQDLGSLAGKAWKKFYKLVLVIFWIMIIAGGAYFWYLIFYGPGWSDADKENFLKAKFPENNLNRSGLEKVLKGIDAQKERSGKEVFTVKDVFRIY